MKLDHQVFFWADFGKRPVIPAKAGIHGSNPQNRKFSICREMDSCFRRNDSKKI
jgi:hypothetical protein